MRQVKPGLVPGFRVPADADGGGAGRRPLIPAQSGNPDESAETSVNLLGPRLRGDERGVQRFRGRRAVWASLERAAARSVSHAPTPKPLPKLTVAPSFRALSASEPVQL